MGNEKQISKERRYVDDEDSTDIKQSWCFNMTSSASTQRTPCKRKSSKSECSTNVRFDDIEQNVERHNDEVEPVKRKLPRKTKGFNVTSKIRKTFTMCCTPGRDLSVENDDKIRDEEKNIRERNSEDLSPSHANLASKDARPDAENRSGKDVELVKDVDRTLQSVCNMMMAFNNASNEEPGIYRTPRNILQIYVADVEVPLTVQNVGQVVRIENSAEAENEADQNEGLVLMSESCSSLSSGDIEHLLDDTDSSISKLTTVWTELKKITDESFKLCLTNDTTSNVIAKWLDGDTVINVPNNPQIAVGKKTIDTVESQVSSLCSLDTLGILIQPIKDIFSSELNNNSPKSDNIYNISPEKSSIDERDYPNEDLYYVYFMLKGNWIKFERLPNDLLCEDKENPLVEFLYCKKTFSHEEAKQLFNEINKLVNSKAIEFKFSESKESSNDIIISSFDGEKLTLSQEVFESVTVTKDIADLTKYQITDTDVETSTHTEQPCDAAYSAFIEDVFYASDGCMTKLTDYISMILDKRFLIFLKDIYKAGDGEIYSVNEYIAFLGNGEFTPVFDGIADETANSVERYRKYIDIIKESNFCNALNNALKTSKGYKYYLPDYIQIIQDGNIIDLLSIILQASKLPDHFVKAIIHDRISVEAGDCLDDLAEDLSPRSNAAYVARRLSAICTEVNVSRNKHKAANQSSSISFTDDAYSNLKKKYSPHSSKNKGPESNGNSSDWSVSSPIVRPKTLSKSCKTGSANQMQNRQIKSIYKPSVRKSSDVSLTKETGTTRPPVNGGASGETEVKHSKAQHDFDLIEDKGASRPAVTRERIIKHARRRTRSFAKQENEPVLVTVEPGTVTTKNDNTPKSGSQLTNATDDVKVDVPKAGEVQPVYIETEATVDYGRCVVEPSYGEKPDRKKLRTGKREKVKTKGQANKHLMAKKENRDFETMIDEYLAEIDDYEEVDDKVEIVAEKEETENATTPLPAVMNAVDQPQVLDDREFHLVPDEIKRVDDPFLEDVEELYKVSTPGSNKKEKRKQKADRKKENRSRKSGQTVLKLA